MSKPAVSVIIPAHNRIDYLSQALDSVAAQTFTDFEVIVVDDGSKEPVTQHAAAHPVAPRVVRQDRQGPAAARNRGIFEARADLIAFLDSDDLWLPTKLERYIEALRSQSECSIFHGPMLPIDSVGRTVTGRTKPRAGGWITRKLFESCFVDVPSVVCRKVLLEKAGGFDASLPVCEDYDLWLRLSVTEPFGLIDEPLAKRRLHDHRLSKTSMSRNLAVKASMLHRFYQQHRDDGLLDDEEARTRLARVCFVAARAAFRDGDYPQAAELSRASRTYGKAPLRATLLSAAAGMLARFSNRTEDSPRERFRLQNVELGMRNAE